MGHCLGLNLLGERSSVEYLIRLFVATGVSGPSQPLFCTGLNCPAKMRKSVDSYVGNLKPLFYVASFVVIKLAAELTTREGSQIARSIGEKL
jgi:hypothetical protein